MSGGTDWAARQRKLREAWVTLGPYSVLARCPDMIDLRRFERDREDVDEACVLRFVVDWKGVTEELLHPGVGGADPVPFTPGAWREFVGGRPQDFETLSKHFADAMRARFKALVEIEGKSPST